MPVFGTGYEIVTSSTRPSNPFNGQVIYETDTKTHKFYDSVSGAWRSMVQPGLVKAFAGRTAPTGWLLCAGSAGSAVTQSAYPDLWSVLTSNGASYPFGGSGTTTYTPDLRGRAIHGLETMGGGASVGLIQSVGGTIGGTSGNELSPAHSHYMGNSVGSSNENTNHGHKWVLGGNGGGSNANDLPHRGYNGWDGNFATWGATSFGYNSGAQRHTHSYSFSGVSTGHSLNGGDQQNLAPAIVMNYIIKI